MKRLIFILLAPMLLLPHPGNSQEVQEGKVKMSKALEMQGFIATSQHKRDAVEATIAGMLKEVGITLHSKRKKYFTYNGILIPTISPTKIDLYYKVQKKKKKSQILFVVSKGYDNYISSGSDAIATANIKNFLGQIDATIAHNEAVKAKEKEIEKADKELEKQKAEARQAEEAKNKKAQELEEMKINK